jgi:MFS family permease
MTFLSSAYLRRAELTGTAAVWAVAAMMGAGFAGSTLVTPLYVIYKQQFGFSQITLTLIYAVYVIGNLAALLFFGRISDEIGRRRTALSAMFVAIASALVFLFAQNTAYLYFGRILIGLGIGVATGTGTAWLAELIGQKDKTRATAIATSTNFIGLGTSAFVAGIIAQYTAWPLSLPFIVYLIALVVVTALIWRTQETVERTRGLSEVSLRPAISVPAAIRAQFVAPAVTGFGAMALVGFYAAISPSMLVQDLHQSSHAVAGATFFELAVIVAVTIIATQSLSSHAAMTLGLVLMIPSVALLLAAQVFASMTLLILATACCGIAAGLGYRGSLQVVNQIAPAEKRAAVVSSYFVCGFSGNALPVVGIGILSTLTSPTIANATFAAVIVVFALVALGFGATYKR